MYACLDIFFRGILDDHISPTVLTKEVCNRGYTFIEKFATNERSKGIASTLDTKAMLKFNKKTLKGLSGHVTRWCARVKICVLNCTPVIVNNWSHTRTCDIMYDMNCAAVEYRLVFKLGQKQPPPRFRLNPCFFLSSGLCRLIPRRLERKVQR